jgi:REP element-mobilizing transposase RayT
VSSSNAAIRMHLVWSTRHRRPWLDPEWRARLFAAAEAIVQSTGGRLLCAGGTRDHNHLYIQAPPPASADGIVDALKAGTTRWVRQSFPHRREFGWQRGYAAFSVTPQDDSELQHQIRNQEVLHRELSFLAEYQGLLERHGVGFDLRYVLQ